MNIYFIVQKKDGCRAVPVSPMPYSETPPWTRPLDTPIAAIRDRDRRRWRGGRGIFDGIYRRFRLCLEERSMRDADRLWRRVPRERGWMDCEIQIRPAVGVVLNSITVHWSRRCRPLCHSRRDICNDKFRRSSSVTGHGW